MSACLDTSVTAICDRVQRVVRGMYINDDVIVIFCLQVILPIIRFSEPFVDNIAHDTMVECSNMGTCDHTTGQCKCFDGYSVSALLSLDHHHHDGYDDVLTF